MAKVTFEVDPVILFDTITKDMKGETKPLGDRLIGVLLQSGETTLRDEIGLTVYGISVVKGGGMEESS
jgi:hypothetical protein